MTKSKAKKQPETTTAFSMAKSKWPLCDSQKSSCFLLSSYSRVIGQKAIVKRKGVTGSNDPFLY